MNNNKIIIVEESDSVFVNSKTEEDVFGFSSVYTLHTFAEMWYRVFLWALFSSISVHILAALIAFATLRKHKFGKFLPLFIVVMGVVPPLTSGLVSSAAVAFVYRYSSFPMAPLYAFFWGVGQTALAACIGFTRILATL